MDDLFKFSCPKVITNNNVIIMKLLIKYQLSRLGILPKIDLLRQLPSINKWITEGAPGVAPPPIKRLVLSAYLHRYNIKQFIETGTHVGDTLAYIGQNKKINCTSIELENLLYIAAKKRFNTYKNVTLLHGDSANLIPTCINKLQQPALFWLDGHYSGGITAKGDTDTPISEELQSILLSPIKNHVILIDDARCFNGTNGYPHIDELLKMVRLQSNYHAEISTDIIRLTPNLQ
jgi:hypothetical protein